MKTININQLTSGEAFNLLANNPEIIDTLKDKSFLWKIYIYIFDDRQTYINYHWLAVKLLNKRLKLIEEEDLKRKAARQKAWNKQEKEILKWEKEKERAAKKAEKKEQEKNKKLVQMKIKKEEEKIKKNKRKNYFFKK